MKIKQISMGLLALTACAFTQAETATGSIEISLNVPKLCTISIPNKVVNLNPNGSASNTSYSVTCNTPYTITNKSANYNNFQSNVVHTVDKNVQLKTLITTTGPNNVNVPIQYATGPEFKGQSVDTFKLNFKLAEAVKATQLAGIYKDTYTIDVKY